MSTLRKIDLTFRSIPTATYKHGVIPLATDGKAVQRYIKWFRTRKAAESWGTNMMSGFAIARLYVTPASKGVA